MSGNSRTGPWAVYEREVIPALRGRWAEVYGAELSSRKRGDELRGCCPLHGGDNAEALSVLVNTGQWCCYTGCKPDPGQQYAGGGPVEYLSRRDGVSSDEALAALARLAGVDLGAGSKTPMRDLDGDALDEAWGRWCHGRKLAPRDVAEIWHVELLSHQRRPAACFATPSGPRIRYLDSGKRKCAWRKRGSGACWYGLEEALSALEMDGTLYIVNGEPSVWACRQSGVPAVCTCMGETYYPGEDMLADLRSALEEASAAGVAVVYDLDPPGRQSAPKMVETLTAAGIQAKALELPEEVGDKGDVDDLHQQTGDEGLAVALAALPELKAPEGADRNIVANFTANKDGRYEVRQADIVASVHKACDAWPRVSNGLLFAADKVPKGELPDHEAIRYLDGKGGEARLFTWLRRHARVEWCGREVEADDRMGKRSPLTRGELVRALELEAKHRYRSVELLPHHPPRPKTYYACGSLPNGKGHALDAFMRLLNPDTDADADLLLAAMVTPGWGGEDGCRPGFILTSDHGVGSGKTATATAISDVWGGALQLQPDEDWQRTVERLLTDEALSKRAVLVDNIRGRLESGAIEAAITASSIGGKRLYHGEFTRPNSITWFCTVNVAEMSRDLADRCVVVKIGAPQHGVDFRGQVIALLKERRRELICDCLAFLRGKPVCTIDQANRDRFQAWQDAVLGRLPLGNELAATIKERRPAVDGDSSEAMDVASGLEAHLKRKGHCPQHEVILIPTGVVKELLGDDMGWRTTRQTTRGMRELCQSKPLRHVKAGHRQGSLGRGVLWAGHEAGDAPVRKCRLEDSRVRCNTCGEAGGEVVEAGWWG